MAEGTFSVFVRCDMNGQGTMTLPGIRTTTLVRQVKQIIIDREGPMVKDVRLNFRGKPLRDEMKMSDYEIRQDSVLSMALRLYGGSHDNVRQFDHQKAKAKGIRPTKANCELYLSSSCDSDDTWRAKLHCGHTICPECCYLYLQKWVMSHERSNVKCPCTHVREPCYDDKIDPYLLFIVASLTDEEMKKYCEKSSQHINTGKGTFSISIRWHMNGERVTTLHGIQNTTLVRELKERMIAAEGVTVKDVRLYFRGKPLRDERRMSDYGITQDSVLFMALRVRGS